MAGDGKKLQPIIVKRIKKGGHAAHGGAWKIAYADFVTAMMAFFLLMWLLGSTAKGELQGIASYFQSPVKVSLMGGPGTGNSSSILPGGGRDLSKAFGQMDSGEAERAAKLIGAQMARAEQARKDAARMEVLERKITSLIERNPKLSEYGSQIQLEKTTDGLHIQIVDQQNRPMFDTGSALVKPYMRDILREIGAALGDVDNRIALAGHTDATPYGSGERGYSNWELSADRANASRRELVAGGLPDDKLRRVEGLASSRLLRPEQPMDPINRRISIVVMTQEAEERLAAPPAPVVVPLAPVPAAPAALPVSAPVPAAPAPTVATSVVAPALQISGEVTKSPSQSGG
ncbi:MAG: flagellar motor protein MotB [Hydrogenophaga sp.]|jgi:chemotaxis protein MotB|uniref:flagellar motor protein MotB n=1 Tax=Hydrogenophaga sp. TaxID=1904254 RepID=UPI00260B8CA5|nr:flagellar motor protein MotB [Hydrogenophaga sp.]MCV0441390.1 flagellar motor protein MotB [Hydrogenophaga sp.]